VCAIGGALLWTGFAGLPLLLTGNIWAQTFQGALRGLVQDPGGAVITDARMSLIDQSTNVTRTTVSNAQGEYSFPNIDPASYTLRVESAGFKTLERKDIIVDTAEQVTLDVKMEVGAVSESIQVNEEVPLIETSNASNGQVIDTDRLTDLPNLGRNVFLLSKLSTNTVPVGDPRFNRFQDQSGSSQISLAGGPIRGNNYLIDGVPVTDSTNRAVIIPLDDGVQEMKVQIGTYDATMGRTGGGVFNTLLKTGTNDLHGDLFGFYRTTAFTANTFFNNASGIPRAATLWKNFGGGVGGPLYIPHVYNGRNKTFFYASSEAYRQHTPVTNGFALPTALERAGNYSQSSVTIFDPMSAHACAPTDNCPAGVSQVRTPFPGNIIPASVINPIGQNIINYLPNPQFAGPTDSINYEGSDSLFDRADEYMGKLDHSVTNWLRLTASFLYYKSREPGGNPLGIVAGSTTSNTPYLLYRHVDNTVVNAIMTPSPTTVVALRYGFNRFPNITEGISLAEGFNEASLGFPAGFLNGLQAHYFPQITLNGESLSNVSFSGSNYYSKSLLTSVSRFIGRHNFTSGFDYRVIHAGPSYSVNAGSFTFNGVFSREYPTVTSTTTGADFADLLLGYPSAGSAATAVPINVFVRYYAGYLQDDIRATNKLTLNVGLRYEYQTGEAEVHNNLVVGFNETQINPIAAYMPAASGVTPYGVIDFAGINGNPNTCCRPSKTQLGPRFGMAYQLNSKTTIRAGIGIFYAPMVFNYSDSVPGYTQTTTYVASTNGNSTPANSLSNPFPTGIIQPSGNTQGAATALGSTFSFLDPNKAGGGTVYQYSFDVQRDLWKGIALEAGYIGSRSTGLTPAPTGTGTLPINEIAPSYLSLGQAALNTSVANPFLGAPGAAGVIGTATITRAQTLLPFPEYSTISENLTFAHAQYDSMVVKVQKRLAAGLTFLSTLTWSKSEDNEFSSGSSNALNGLGGAGTGGVQNIYNLPAEWALAAADTPIRVTGTWSYELPFGKGKRLLSNNTVANWVVGGWSVHGTLIVNTGFPLFVIQSNNNAGIGGQNQRPNATGVNACYSGNPESRLNTYLNPAAFSQAPTYTYGNVSRDISCESPGQSNTDASLFKTFSFKERFRAQFRATALNAFNTPLFAPPITNIGLKTFGNVTYQANIPRVLELGLRLMW
jgi:trimeric autotransporter adhesin